MGEKLIIGPINKGLRNDRTAFVIDNDSFPVLRNAYQWRGRVKRKRGTEFLSRLRRPMLSDSIGSTTVGGTFSGNIFMILSITGTPAIQAGSLTISDGINTFTDNGNGTLTGVPGGTGDINYATGELTLSGAALTAPLNATFAYYPDLPVMGLEEFIDPTAQFPGCVAFDTDYSYQINTNSPYLSYATNYYKNPSTGSYPGYIQKTTPLTSLIWNGEDYQQFDSTNYQGALWATNGIEIPFVITNIGMQYKPLNTPGVSVTVLTPTTASLAITSHGLVVGDFIFVNEVVTTTGINFQTGYVTTVTDANNVVVTFPNATLATNGTEGIAQYLTSNVDPTKDCLRIYDGSPVSTTTPPTFNTNHGWVNFCPPLSLQNYSVSDLPAARYYLVGARLIQQFKDRILFFGPVIQTSAAGSQKYLQDTIIYSQNGTPYYTASFPYALPYPTASTLVLAAMNPILVPINQTSFAGSFVEDVTGYAGFLQAGYDQPITTVSSNEDVLMVGFSQKQSRLVYTGNDITPFNLYVINSELGSEGSFSSINLDRGALSIGSNGIILAEQTSAQRIDLEIPDQIFQFNLATNGAQRICAQRDFINEWVYFTYSSNDANTSFPNQTLLYNYRDHSWAMFDESYTTYGTFRKTNGETWDELNYFIWNNWNTNWDSGELTIDQPLVIGGNQQGFVMVKGQGTEEDPSLFIQSISGSIITSPNHNLANGQYIIITGCLGTIGSQVNGKVFSIYNQSNNTFTLNPSIGAGTYLGEGQFSVLPIPFIQTKQFPTSWQFGRKTRIGVQQYLLTNSGSGQTTLYIYLSQNGATPYNKGPVLPDNNSSNDSLIYETILYTCPESENIGLTPANINLQMPLASNQQQIWHRMNTSLIGDTVQIAITLSDDQMSSLSQVGTPLTITGATQANPCVLTCDNSLNTGNLITISGVIGMVELNGNTYNVLSATTTTIMIEIDSTGFAAYISGGTATVVAPLIQSAEIELHSIIMDLYPSQMLS